ncbi:MAG: TldD/PmbA family protein, partial [Candidatus Methanomethylicus sp.]|nr:TldD/PmbA family protein [Candidatus Methanomethylicus sp.]
SKEGTRLAKWSEGKHDVLFGQIIAANLLESIGHASSAFSVESGTSCLANKLGKKVTSSDVTIIDDGSNPEMINSRAFDDEGTPTKRNVIVKEGILKTYLHNSETAKRFNTVSTGNGGWIAPVPWNLEINSGKLSMDEMFATLNNGIYAVSNWYTRFQNYSTGDFSTICRDGTFLVEGGEIKGALKGVRISDNLLRTFSAVKGMGNHRKWVHWWEVRLPVLLPSMVVSDVSLTKAQERTTDKG